MTPSEIERVARAMCEADGFDPNAIVSCVYTDENPPQKWQGYISDARRFLAAHRAIERMKDDRE